MGSERRQRRIRQVVRRRQTGAVVLEDIHDPHNAQAVFRTVDALGFQRICLVFDKQKPFSPYDMRHQSSSSALKWLSYEVYRHIDDCAASLREGGYELLATVPDSGAESIYDAELLAPRIALMLGNEHRGLSRAAITASDRRLSVPMYGMVQSLNLSVTAAICLYEISRQRRAAGVEEYLLDPDARSELVEDFNQR
jgi:tRNA (guanosine-2'-O-)-methyltransferase